ncbi:putative cytochrome P450 monooxygenase [Xylariaceae sp. FL1272]|nr:putative cytochrome P450 monooxygenase [Xylariaceae sp. FL1272]
MLLRVLAAIAAVAVTFFVNRLRYMRFRQFSQFTQHPSSLLLGHLKAPGGYAKLNKPDAHIDLAMVAISEALGRPPVMFLDMRPIGDPLAVVADYEVEDANDDWRLLRKRFNPGFASQHSNTFVPEILDKGLISPKRASFSLINLTTHLTFDIIGKVSMEAYLNAQHQDESQRGNLVVLFEALMEAYTEGRLILPWWLTPGKDVVQARSVLSLASLDIDELTPDVMDVTCDQLHTFLFAGHDTTTIPLSWVFYELSRTPHAKDAINAELDNLLGPDSSNAAVRTRLLEQSDLLQQMPYVSAVIKEALRLHPHGGTVRMIPPGNGFIVHMPNGDTQCLYGLMAYNCQTLIHSDPKIFGDSANVFVPEWWISEKCSDETLYPTRKITSKPADGMMMTVKLV